MNYTVGSEVLTLINIVVSRYLCHVLDFLLIMPCLNVEGKRDEETGTITIKNSSTNNPHRIRVHSECSS